MNVCENPCFDCPFSRDCDHGLPDGEDSYSFYARHMTGLYVPYICPEQDEVCFGQITMMANQTLDIMLKDHELQSIVHLSEPNRVVYFVYCNEFIRYHREGYIFGAEWLRDQEEKRGCVTYQKPEQLSLF